MRCDVSPRRTRLAVLPTRSVLATSVAAVLIGLAGVISAAASHGPTRHEGGFAFSPRVEQFYWNASAYSTSSTQWAPMREPFRPLGHRGPVTMTISGTFSGGPVDVRILWAGPGEKF